LAPAIGRTDRVRLRTLGGTWLVAHASSPAGSGQVALVLEPAKASEIAPIVIEAYGLTAREVEISSRGELTSKLFAEQYHGPLNDATAYAARRSPSRVWTARR
jgi:hypothetical protein